MQRVTLQQAIMEKGEGQVRVEYIGEKAAGTTFQVPGGRTFVLSKSPVNKFHWATPGEAQWLIRNANCRRVVQEEPVKAEVPFQAQPVTSKKLEADKPVPTPTASKIEAMVDPSPPSVDEEIKKRRGRKPKS